jgi:CubicO group peptidase (beta-lactamase class C family)
MPPEGWSMTRAEDFIRFAPPEGDLMVALVPTLSASNGTEAASATWKVVQPSLSYPVRIAQDLPARDGWDQITVVSYDVPPAVKAVAQVIAFRRGQSWTVLAVNGANATLAKRGAQINGAIQSLRPVGYAKESFAGRVAHPLNAARLAVLKSFALQSMAALKIPGAGLAVIDRGRIVYEGGLGTKDVSTGAPVDQNTLFMIASNTKGMSTLLLASLVDQGRLDWNKPVIDYLPSFRLGSEETTRKVLVKHLVCACTGLPRKDMDWLFNTRPDTSANETFRQLAATQPTSGFGEVYQYNNLMASAAGYLAAHIIYPKMELGAAYDRAMQERIFTPLGMTSTTLSTPRAIRGNWARPYDSDLYGRIALVDMKFNDTVVPYRPAGGAWSSAHDMALYVMNELNKGKLPNGRQMMAPGNLLARRVHNVPVGEKKWYGMGLQDDQRDGVSVISHGGSMFGYKSNWFALPEAGVGLVVLTNSENGYTLANQMERRLLEILYEGKPESAENVASAASRSAAELAKFRSELTLPVTAPEATALVGDYANPALGPLVVRYDGGKLTMQATSIWSEAALKKNKDGTTSLVSISPGIGGLDLLMTQREGRRALVLNDGQHEYAFVEARAPAMKR